MVARDVQAEPKDLLGSYTLYDSVIVDICHYVFIRIYRVYNIKHKPYGNWTLGENDAHLAVSQRVKDCLRRSEIQYRFLGKCSMGLKFISHK